MSVIQITNVFIANTRAKSAEVNQNFTDLVNILAGHHHDPNIYTNASPITNSGIAANAKIRDTQLDYPITRSGLINYLALDNVPVEKGGLGLAGGFGVGDLFYANSPNTIARLPIGGIAQFLSVNPAGDGFLYVDRPANNIGNVVSGENLTAGQPIYINPSDSLVYKGHGYKAIDSTALTLTATAIGRISKLSNTQYLYLYHNGGTTLSIGLRGITTNSDVDTETVTTAYDQTKPSTTTLPHATVCRLSDTTFVVIYAKTTSNAIYFRTGSVSGSTITLDTETVYPGSPDCCFGFSSVPGASDGKVVFSYLDTTSDNGTGTCVPKLDYLTVTTNSVTVTYTTSGAGVPNGSFNTDVVWTVCTFTQGIAYGLFCIQNGGGTRQITCNTIEVNSGGTTVDNTVPNLESQTGSGTPSTYSQYIPSLVGHNGKAYFGWATTNNGTPYVNTKTVLEVSQSGCRIHYQTTTVRLGGDTTTEALSMIGNEMGVIVFGFLDTNNSASVNIYIQRDKIYEFYDYFTLGNVTKPTPTLWYSNQKDEIVLAIDTTYIKTWRIPTLVDGLVIANVTAPAEASIYDVIVTTSGLTSGAVYFLKDTYTTTGDMDFKGIVPVGKALSTTLMRFFRRL